MASTPSQPAHDEDIDNLVKERVLLATKAYQTGQNETINAASAAFEAPYRRTRSHCEGHPRKLNGGNSAVLDEATETALNAPPQQQVAQGTHISSQKVRRTTNDILGLSRDDGKQRQRWARQYLAPNRDIFKNTKGKTQSLKRRSGDDDDAGVASQSRISSSSPATPEDKQHRDKEGGSDISEEVERSTVINIIKLRKAYEHIKASLEEHERTKIPLSPTVFNRVEDFFEISTALVINKSKASEEYQRFRDEVCREGEESDESLGIRRKRVCR